MNPNEGLPFEDDDEDAAGAASGESSAADAEKGAAEEAGDTPDTSAPDEPTPPLSHPPGSHAGAKGRDYEVGYGRPPKSGQIQPGEVRNPNGRPGGSRNMKTIAREIHNTPITIREGGKTRRRPAIHALMLQDFHNAMKGHDKAIMRHINLALQLSAEDEVRERAREAKTDSAELSKDDAAILADYIKAQLNQCDDDASAMGASSEEAPTTPGSPKPSNHMQSPSSEARKP